MSAANLIQPTKHDFSDIQDMATWAFETLSAMYGTELAATQLGLEHEAYTLGEERFHKTLERQMERGEFSDNAVAKPVLSTLVPLMAVAFDNWVEHQVTKVRRKHVGLQFFQLVRSESVAAITVKTVLNLISKKGPKNIQSVAVFLGRALEEEARFGRIREQEADHFNKRIRKTLNKRNGHTYKVKYLEKVEAHMQEANELTSTWTAWDSLENDMTYHIGIRLLELLIESTQLVEVNCAGVDKVDFSKRKAWVTENEALILEIARDPLGQSEWTKMDSPFCFLAFCFEWAGVVEHGELWESALPIAFDGSCSGIQHFSAMLRDERGGRAVNLLPSDEVQDIYRLVSDEVIVKVKDDLLNGTEDSIEMITNEKTGEIIERRILGTKMMAAGWLGYGINRGVTKRSVMTLAYGSKAFGFTDQVREDIIQPAIDNADGARWFPNAQQCARYMANLIWDSVSIVVVAAVEAMNWLQKAAKLLASEVLETKKTKKNPNPVVLKPCMPVYWVTPDGFPVWQEYMKPVQRRIDLMFLGTVRLQATINVRDSDTIDGAKQESGISPNFVHSQDGSHLRKTVVKASECYGVEFFALIHDSFGTIPAKAGKMFKAVRETMVETYTENDVLDDFREQFMEQLHESQLDKMPPVPAKGTLDITQILESEFAFA